MAVKKEKSNFSPELLASYDKLISSVKGLERKGAAMPYTSVNGHMFSFIAADGSLGLRLPEAERTGFIKKYKTHLCEAHGTVLKEYVVVPDKLFNSAKELTPWFITSHTYVRSLKPKPPKKTK